MELYGRKVEFLRTVLANCKIADMCPEGDLKNAGKLFEGSYQKSQGAAAKFISYLNEGYEMNRKYSDPSYEPHVITLEEIMCLPDELFDKAFMEALKAYNGEKTTVNTEPANKKKAARK